MKQKLLFRRFFCLLISSPDGFIILSRNIWNKGQLTMIDYNLANKVAIITGQVIKVSGGKAL